MMKISIGKFVLYVMPSPIELLEMKHEDSQYRKESFLKKIGNI